MENGLIADLSTRVKKGIYSTREHDLKYSTHIKISYLNSDQSIAGNPCES